MPPPVSSADHPRRLLADRGISPSRRRGQNFLHDRNIARKIGAAAREMGPPFLEIGPGLGALTSLLAAAQEKTVAVGVDRGVGAYRPGAAPRLRRAPRREGVRPPFGVPLGPGRRPPGVFRAEDLLHPRPRGRFGRPLDPVPARDPRPPRPKAPGGWARRRRPEA